MSSAATPSSSPPPPPSRLDRILGWRRVRFTLIVALPFGLLLARTSGVPVGVGIMRTETLSLVALIAFGVFELWPARLPGWVARWVWQLIGVAVAVPIGTMLAIALTRGYPQVVSATGRAGGYSHLFGMGLFFAPWIALGAMVRQRDALARDQALAFALERSELERQALDARMRLLQAQVQPHFLFNTLANIRALVNAGSPQASAVLDSLIAYLRAAVPRLDETTTTLGQELELVRAYLELMHMRMPDRLQFAIHVDEAARGLRNPPMAVLTLVENAVRHGIDPSEEGGRIEVSVSVREGRCIVRVTDTGVGLLHAGDGLGTGLTTLRERMQLMFGGDAQLRLTGLVPHGVSAELEFPAEPATRSAP
ncbi:MAG: sensor histidine kinase [Rhizobacter sp.]